jgi:hypothetical protein
MFPLVSGNNRGSAPSTPHPVRAITTHDDPLVLGVSAQHRHGIGTASTWRRHSIGTASARHRHGIGTASVWRVLGVDMVSDRHHHGGVELGPHVTRLQSKIVDALAPDSRPDGSDAAPPPIELPPGLDATLWLSLLEVLSEAAEELSAQVAPAEVEVRLRGRSPHLVVIPPDPVPLTGPAEPGDRSLGAGPEVGQRAGPEPDLDDGPAARVNLRLPEGLKRRAEQAARRERSSLNAWLVGVVADAVAADRRPGGSRGRRYSGWVR